MHIGLLYAYIIHALHTLYHYNVSMGVSSSVCFVFFSLYALVEDNISPHKAATIYQSQRQEVIGFLSSIQCIANNCLIQLY